MSQAEQANTPEERLKEPLEGLVRYGRFNMIKATVDGAKSMDPGNKALRNIFLQDADKHDRRAELKQRLLEWKTLLSDSEGIEQALGKAEEKAQEAEKLLNVNLNTALEATKDLEQAYRSVALFFKNAELDKIKNITFLNADIDQLSQEEEFPKAVRNELEWSYNRLSKAENYTIMAIPGYLGSNDVLREWAKMASSNKCMLFTDFQDLDDHESVIDLFDEGGFQDLDKTNVVMASNWLIGREAYSEVGEEEGVSIPPSAALAGKVYNPDIPMSQPVAGKQYGTLTGVKGAKFKLQMDHIGQLDQRGLVPMVQEYGGVMAYSARTLFNGDDVGLKTYSVVMVFDWVGKVISDFLNRAAFENATNKMLQDYRTQIVKFLNSIKGNGRLIKNFEVKKFSPDTENGQPDRILVHVVMEPYFPAKSFAIKMDGTKGDGIDQYKWNTSIEEV